MQFKQNIFIFAFAALFSISTKVLSSDIKESYTIISETQTNNENGIFEANGNVRINGENNFSASSDKLIYEKSESKLNLKGNVEIENYQIDNIFIDNIIADELILYIDKGRLLINSTKGNRVKTKLKL